MNKQQILNITGLTEKEFYNKYPDQESFCNDYPQACQQLAKAAEGIEVTGSLTSPEEVQKLGKAYGFRTDSNQNFQQDMYNYVAKNKPELFKQSISKFGPANAGLTNYGSVQGYKPDAYIGPRVADMMGKLGTPKPQAPVIKQPQPPKYVEYSNANVRQQYDFNRGMQQKYVGSNVAPTPIPSQPAMPATFPGQQPVASFSQNPAGGWNIGPAQAPGQPGNMPARQQGAAPAQGGQPQMSHMGPWHTNQQGEYTRYYTNTPGDMNPGIAPGSAPATQQYGGSYKDGGNVPTNPALWSRAKAAAKSKYDVYPSAYANGFAAKWYKSHGGGWRKAEYGMEVPMMAEGGKPEWLIEAQLKAQGYSGDALNQKLSSMAQGGEPQNAGFQALPDYVQEKIMNNMAKGGEQDETQESIMAALKQGMKPQEILKKLVAMGLTKEQAAAYIQSAVQHPASQYDNTYVNDSNYDYMAEGGEPNGGMALGQMMAVADKMNKLSKFVTPDKNLDPWIASKLAVMDDSAAAIADYMMYNPEAGNEQEMDEMKNGGYVVRRSHDRKGKTHVVIGPDGTKKYFGDSKMGQHPNDPARKKAFYARHKHNLEHNPYFRAFARATWEEGGEIEDQGGGMFADGGSFSKAFAEARKELGAGKIFTWQGKDYTTNYANENDDNEIQIPAKVVKSVKKENVKPNLNSIINDAKMNNAVGSFMQRNVPAVPVDNTYVQNQRADYYNHKLLIPMPVKKGNGYEQKFISDLLNSDPRHLESGMIEDKNKNVMYVLQNGKVVKTYPIMTGLNKDGNVNNKGLGWLESHPKEALKMRATPVGTYFSNPASNIYGRKGFRMEPIPAFGQPAPLAKDLAQHVVYGNAPAGTYGHDPAEYARRMKIMAGPGKNRVGSYGCTNMYGEDIDCLTGQLFPKGDTTIVVDTRNPLDRNFIQNVVNQDQFGGEMKYGGIHLDPAKKGTFKAQATRMGMSVQAAAAHILANKEDYSPAMVKKANFARNFAKEEGGQINQYKHGGYIGMDGNFHIAKGSGTFSGNAYYADGGEEDPNLTAPYDGSNPNILPPFDPSQYQAVQLPTGYTGYSKKDPATGQFVPIQNVRKDDLWKHLSGSQKWNTGQTATQKVGRGFGQIGDVLNTALVGAEGYSNYLKNNEAQNEYNNYTQNMGTSASLYGINAPAVSRGDYSVTGSSYGKLKPNQYAQYSKMGGPVERYDVGGGFISDELKYNNMDAPPLFTQSLANASNMYSAADNTYTSQSNYRLSGLPNSPNNVSVSESGTDVATKLNNPTNMIYSSWMAKLGAQPSSIKQTDGNGYFAHFPDINTALKAYETQMFGAVDGVFNSRYYKPDTTVDKALRTWSGNGYGGNIYPQIANKTLGELTAAERRELIKRQIKNESSAMYSQLKKKGILQMGGTYQEGGIVEMTDKEIKQFLANGGQLEFLD